MYIDCLVGIQKQQRRVVREETGRADKAAHLLADWGPPIFRLVTIRGDLFGSHDVNSNKSKKTFPEFKFVAFLLRSGPGAMFAFLTNTSKECAPREESPWTSDPNMMSLAQQAQILSHSVSRKTRRRHLKKYKDCFLGDDACRWLVDSGLSPDIPHAVQLGNEFLRNGFVADVCGGKSFRDSGLYRFDDAAISSQVVEVAQSPESVFSDVNLSPTIELVEDSPTNMSSLDLDLSYTAVADQLRMSSFDTDDMANTPPPMDKFGRRPQSHPMAMAPLTRSMPMLIDKQSKMKRPSNIYRQHHNHGNRLLGAASEPIIPSIALFASTTEFTPEPLAVQDDGDESLDLTVSLSETAPRGRKSTDFDLPDIHSLEDSLSEIEIIDNSMDTPVPNHSEELDSEFVFCRVYFAKDGCTSNMTNMYK